MTVPSVSSADRWLFSLCEGVESKDKVNVTSLFSETVVGTELSVDQSHKHPEKYNKYIYIKHQLYDKTITQTVFDFLDI